MNVQTSSKIQTAQKLKPAEKKSILKETAKATIVGASIPIGFGTIFDTIDLVGKGNKLDKKNLLEIVKTNGKETLKIAPFVAVGWLVIKAIGVLYSKGKILNEIIKAKEAEKNAQN